MNRQLLLLELNEINFEFVRAYINRGHLLQLAALIDRHGVAQTVSEAQHDHVEPWIQWVTAHTGQTFAEHQVFRLGDIVGRDLPQIWEELERMGQIVGAISPMNASLRATNPAFFVPDPWTDTGVVARAGLRRLHEAIRQVVADNAKSRIDGRSVAALISGLAAYAASANYAQYIQLTLTSRRRPWRKSMLLDLLLADIFVRETRRAQPNFASLFLNAGAHIQHHYLFCSEVYSGSQRNPPWYVQGRADPVLEVYELYDRIVGRVVASFPTARVMIATGLHQVPHEHNTFYWRLRDHAQFLHRAGVHFQSVEPRMSRDFLVRFNDLEEARRAEARLRSARTTDGLRLFEVDSRGQDAFVTLTYPKDVTPTLCYEMDGRVIGSLAEEVVFVAVKNGEHDGIGYFVDTGKNRADRCEEFPLRLLPSMIFDALGLHGNRRSQPAGLGLRGSSA